MSTKKLRPVKISLADYDAIQSNAEKVSKGEFNVATVLRGILRNKFGISTHKTSPLIDAVWDAAKKPEVDVQNETRLYLAQFNLIIEGDGVNYRLVKRDDNSCELEPIPEKKAEVWLEKPVMDMYVSRLPL